MCKVLHWSWTVHAIAVRQKQPSVTRIKAAAHWSGEPAVSSTEREKGLRWLKRGGFIGKDFSPQKHPKSSFCLCMQGPSGNSISTTRAKIKVQFLILKPHDDMWNLAGDKKKVIQEDNLWQFGLLCCSKRAWQRSPFCFVGGKLRSIEWSVPPPSCFVSMRDWTPDWLVGCNYRNIVFVSKAPLRLKQFAQLITWYCAGFYMY